jgi:hypothetical protein
MKTYELRYPLPKLDERQRAALMSMLEDFVQFGEYHPYMVKVTPLGPSPGGGARYHIDEEITLLGVIPQRPAYDVEVFARDGVVEYRSRVNAALSLKIVWSIEGAALVERVELAGLLPVMVVFIRILAPAHKLTVDAMLAALPA